jgi:peptidoglycan hydrolase CwlO-like protein
MELHSNGAIPDVIPQEEIEAQQSSDYASSPTQSSLENKPKVDINFSMNISNKSELAELLKIFQNQIDTIKTTIDKLVKTAISSDQGITKSKTRQEKSGKTLQKKNKNSITDGFDELLAPPEELSDLPPKPESLKNKDDDLPGLPKLDTKDKLKPVPKPKSGKKTKKSDLLSQKDTLESKISSVKNLIDFIEKKYASKQMDKKSYEKRINQLKSDLEATQDRIDEIKKQL